MRFTAAFVTIAAANLAAATAIGVPVRRTDGGDSPSNQCNTGTISCCNSVQSSSSSLVTTLAGLLGVVLGGVTGQVGVSCSPITVVGASGTSCSAQPACCTGNSFNGGLLTLGCSPINLNL